MSKINQLIYVAFATKRKKKKNKTSIIMIVIN